MSGGDQKLSLARKRRVWGQIRRQAGGDGEEGAIGRIVRDERVQGAHVGSGACEAPEHDGLSQLIPVGRLQIQRNPSPENAGRRAQNLSKPTRSKEAPPKSNNRPLLNQGREDEKKNLLHGGAEQLDEGEERLGLGSVPVSEDSIDEEVEARHSRSPLARIKKHGPRLVVCDQVIAKHCVLGSVQIVPGWERKRGEAAASKFETER